jgi:2-phosphosulfolactate phosphatase
VPLLRCRRSVATTAVAASPEAELVAAQLTAAAARLPAVLSGLASGRELIADGYRADVDLAAAHDVSAAAPRLFDGILSDGGGHTAVTSEA